MSSFRRSVKGIFVIQAPSTWPHAGFYVWRGRKASDMALRVALDAVNRALPDYARVRDIVRADAPFTLCGKQLTVKPCAGRLSRLCSFSR